MTDFISPVRCMVTIVDRGKGDRVVDLCRAQHVAVQLVMLGHGTASAEVMDYLGLDEPEKDIVLSLLPGIKSFIKFKDLIALLTQNCRSLLAPITTTTIHSHRFILL